ncbi:hypothetical protein EON65_09330 [archaeon]|nr:MAG: hypothetical protein EON65_09330 [archaeon]
MAFTDFKLFLYVGTDTMVVHHRVIGGKTYSVTMIGDNIFYELFVLEKSTFDRLNKKDLPEPPEKKKETTGEGATVDAEPALPPQPPVATEDVCSWQCSVCTLINSDEDSQCMVCFTPRDADTPAEDASAGVGWWCPHCTFINALRTTV